MLAPETQRLQREWEDAVAIGARERMLVALDVFLDALLAEPPAVWKAWSRSFAARTDAKVRMPLFRRALLPALAEGVVAREPGCARWLAKFWVELHHCSDGLPDHLKSAYDLLREAIALDPDDLEARRMMLATALEYFAYTLHEVPSGVLYGTNGASVAECDDLLEYLDEVRAHAERLGRTEAHAALFARCALHYRAYRDYLESGREGGSYEMFLHIRGLDES